MTVGDALHTVGLEVTGSKSQNRSAAHDVLPPHASPSPSGCGSTRQAPTQHISMQLGSKPHTDSSAHSAADPQGPLRPIRPANTASHAACPASSSSDHVCRYSISQVRARTYSRQVAAAFLSYTIRPTSTASFMYSSGTEPEAPTPASRCIDSRASMWFTDRQRASTPYCRHPTCHVQNASSAAP